MLNRLISLVFLLSFLNINSVYSDTDFLLPLEKPSIFKKTEKQIQESVSKNLPVPKPKIKSADTSAPKQLKEKKETKQKDEVKLQKKSSVYVFILPEKKPKMLENLRSIFYKMDLSEKETRILSSVFASLGKKRWLTKLRVSL